jgi:metal-responsive CopG/Arc/MetJ family transcriptional regulator
MPNAKTVCITLPPELLKKARKVAARESRTMSELFREALRHYMAEGSVSSKGAANDGKQSELASAGSSDATILHSFRMEKPLK